MADADRYAAARTASTLNLVAGAWLIIAPWAVGYTISTVATWNSIVIGTLTIMFAGIRISTPDRNRAFSWINAVLGFWLIIAPWVFQYGNVVREAAWNETLVGIAIALLAIGSATSTRRLNAR